MPAEPHRPDGWIVTYLVEVVFDTNQGRTGYDHVGTVARCTSCGERLHLSGSPALLAGHARRHEGGHRVKRSPTATSDDPRTCLRWPESPGSATHIASVHREEVTTEHTSTD